ncbi:hypothetical protein D3C72_1254750 [compost metagenome]
MNAAGFDPREEGVELVMVYIAHQHRIDFDFVETGFERRIDPLHHLAKLILPGDGVKLACIEAVDADVDGRETRIAPLGHIAG